MKLEPIFGTMQRDGRNKNGQTMFKCLLEGCSHRSTWYNQEHGHKKLAEAALEKAKADAKKAEKNKKARERRAAKKAAVAAEGEKS
jgi:hypothetical protein